MWRRPVGAGTYTSRFRRWVWVTGGVGSISIQLKPKDRLRPARENGERSFKGMAGGYIQYPVQ